MGGGCWPQTITHRMVGRYPLGFEGVGSQLALPTTRRVLGTLWGRPCFPQVPGGPATSILPGWHLGTRLFHLLACKQTVPTPRQTHTHTYPSSLHTLSGKPLYQGDHLARINY